MQKLNEIICENLEVFSSNTNVVRCAIWYHLQNFKNVKNTHGGVLILVKLQAINAWNIFGRNMHGIMHGIMQGICMKYAWNNAWNIFGRHAQKMSECDTARSSHQRCSIQEGVLKNFSKFTEKHLVRVFLLTKLQLKPGTLLKKRLWHRCFLANFVKFLRRTFLQKHLWATASDIFNKLIRNEKLATSDCLIQQT